ncbi:MAG: zinc metallopeptidase [Clostridia bacterium]|nr:zinc metallopeptidase [Clostridia bacterium]
MPLLDEYEYFQNVNPALQWAIFIVGILIIAVGVVSVGVSLWLMYKYIKFNRTTNSANINGRDAARKLLDQNGLQHIAVSTWGSFIFGNSYSHYFNKVRLRRLTQKKKSITALAMAAEKTALAVLDQEDDPDMRTRVRLTPLMYFGPIAFLPLIIIGALIDYILFSFTGVATIIAALVGLSLYAISFVLAIKVLKTEVKAQRRALQMLVDENMVTAEETAMMQELFHIYNIQYVNDIVMACLEMIMRVLNFVADQQDAKAFTRDN